MGLDGIKRHIQKILELLAFADVGRNLCGVSGRWGQVMCVYRHTQPGSGAYLHECPHSTGLTIGGLEEEEEGTAPVGVPIREYKCSLCAIFLHKAGKYTLLFSCYEKNKNKSL